MTEIESGKLRHRVGIYERSNDIGTRGQSLNEWQCKFSRWAEFEFLNGSELEHARQIVATAAVRVTIRKPVTFFDVSEAYQVEFKGVRYNVQSVLPAGERMEDLEMLCEVVK